MNPTNTKESDGAQAMVNRSAPPDNELLVALWEERAASTDRHKLAIEHLAVTHHGRIEELTTQLFMERREARKYQGELVDQITAKNLKAYSAERFIGKMGDSLKEIADPKNWSGSVCTVPDAQFLLQQVLAQLRIHQDSRNW